MEKEKLVEALKRAGLTGQEALLYLALLENNGITGYEAAKMTGISRSNAYAALVSLVKKGMAIPSQEKVKKYVALAKPDLLATLKRRNDDLVGFLATYLPDASRHAVPYLTISGHDNILEKIFNLLDLVEKRVYLSIHSDQLAILADPVRSCVDRGIKTVIVSNKRPDIDGLTFYRKKKQSGFVKIIADTAKILTTDFTREPKNCLYSEDPQLVQLMREAILNEIELHKRDRTR